MDWLIYPIIVLLLGLVAVCVWFCLNVIVYQLENTDKPFFDWLNGK